jgi:hypothetical protein
MSSQFALGDLIGVAAIVLGFGVTVVMFRIQRELQMQEANEPIWIARSDVLILASIFASVFLVLLPLLLLPKLDYVIAVARAGCVAAIILEAGYIPAILAHYRIGFGKDRHGPRTNPEPTERLFVWLFAIFAAGCFSFALLSSSPH